MDLGYIDQLDPYIIQLLGQTLVHQQQCHDLVQLIQSCHQLRRLYQPILTDEYQRLLHLPPNVEEVLFQEWHDAKGQRHRDLDLPAVVFRHGRREWYRHGRRHRGRDQPGDSRS